MKRYLSLLTLSITATGASLIAAAASPPVSLTSNQTNIGKGRGVVVFAEGAAKTAPKGKLNIDRQGVILKGYDPVAYFTLHRAVKGNTSFQSRFGGATYEFASAADKAAFDKNPSRYVPQYGAFCANYVKKGELRDIDPTVFFIYKSKLYVCSAGDEAKEFRSNIDTNIQSADNNWRQLTGS
jgi:YHS domain-containing protein